MVYFLHQISVVRGNNGMTEDEQKALRALLREEINAAVYASEQRVGGLAEGLGRLDQRVEGLDQRVGGLADGLGRLDQRMGGLDQRVGGLADGLGRLDQRMGGLDQHVGGLAD